MSAPMYEQAELLRQRNAFRDQRNAVFATNTELLARVERVGLERLQVENENRTLKRRVAELETAAAVQALGALPMPTGAPAPSPWERAVTGLNALADAGIAFSIELDGHIANPFGDEHIEWDQDASRWRLVRDDEDEVHPSHPASVEDPHDGPLHSSYALPHDLPVLPAQRDQWGQA